MENIKIGILGGSGFYKLENIKIIDQIELDTAFGKPSAPYFIGEYNNIKLAFLARHGSKHQYSPTEINYKANIYGFKKLGVDIIISFSAVGSLQEQYKPGDFVIIDQFFDRTKHRDDTFFKNGIVAHVQFGDPVCPILRNTILQSSKHTNITIHDKGTYVCMEGPAFSTRAESLFYQSNNFSVIGMTNLTEAKLAREAEIHYATVAMVTDYDCWHIGEEEVSVDLVVKTLQTNTKNAQKLLINILDNINFENFKNCKCGNSLQNAIISNLKEIPEDTKNNLYEILKKYL